MQRGPAAGMARGSADKGMPGMGGMGAMMRQMMTMHEMGGMDSMHGPSRVEGQLAFAKAELKITDAQAAQWRDFAGAVRAASSRSMAMPAGGMHRDGPVSAVDQVSRRVDMLSARLDATKTIATAVGPLYATLSDEQKKTADQLMAEYFRRP
jgi:hypothetical protein